MIKNFDYEANGYILQCKGGSEIVGLDVKKYVVIEGFSGGGSKLYIPDIMEIDGESIPVTALEKKAFLGAGSLREVSLPHSLVELSDWAFAQCPHLHTVVFRELEQFNQLKLGRGVFSECPKITYICIGSEEKNALAVLLGAVLYRMDAEYLLNAEDVGLDTWFAKWDQCLESFLTQDDSEGYINMVLCGEEDLSASADEYVKDQRKKKAALCMLRLQYEDLLGEESKQIFVNYLRNHTKGCETEEAWEVILSEFGDEIDYFKLFAKLGCIHEQNIDAMIADMGELHAEAKAYLIGYKQDNFAKQDFFAGFDLDLL